LCFRRLLPNQRRPLLFEAGYPLSGPGNNLGRSSNAGLPTSRRSSIGAVDHCFTFALGNRSIHSTQQVLKLPFCIHGSLQIS
jgi:hypothetical protein